jgi:hypothetical protein
MTPRANVVVPGKRVPASRSRSRSWGCWLMGLSVLGLAAVGATLTWTRHAQVTSHLAPHPVAISAVPAAQPAPVAAASGEATARMLASAPELNQRSAEMLLTSRSFPTEEGLAESTLVVAEAGFERLDRSEVRELGDLFSQVYAGLGVADRQWMSTYVDKMRRASLSPEEARRGRELLSLGIKSLPPGKHLRLQALLAEAIAAGLQGRREAEERQRLAQLGIASNEPVLQRAVVEADGVPASATVAPTAGAWRSQPVGSSGQKRLPGSPSPEPAEVPARGEGYWRTRMPSGSWRSAPTGRGGQAAGRTGCGHRHRDTRDRGLSTPAGSGQEGRGTHA